MSTRGLPHIAAVIIARDAMMDLPHCIASLEGAADEVVVVDTGSKDGTRATARAAGARVVVSCWRDFAAARNLALRSSSAEWLFMIDSDERLAPGSAHVLRRFAARARAAAGRVVIDSFIGGDDVVARREEYAVRLLRRAPGLSYLGAVHEEVETSLKRTGTRVGRVGQVRIHHDGYRDPDLYLQKLRRNVALLAHDYHAGRVSKAQLAWSLGMAFLHEGRHAKALACLWHAVGARTGLSDAALAEAHARRAQLLLRCESAASAARDSELSMQLAPDDPLCRFVHAQWHVALGQHRRAIPYLRSLRTGPAARTLRRGVVELLLGEVMMEIGEVGEAARAFASAAHLRPGDDRPTRWLREIAAGSRGDATSAGTAPAAARPAFESPVSGETRGQLQASIAKMWA